MRSEPEDLNDDIEQPEVEIIHPDEDEEAEGSAGSDVAGTAFLADMEDMRKELEQTQAKAEEYLDGWQRARAEFANYRKRVDRDQAQTYQNAVGSVVKRYIEIVDDLERALNNRPQTGDGAAWAQGIELVYRKLLTMLEAEGVKIMNVEGEFFDPNRHEAITQEESDKHESGQVISVVKQGYMLGDRVLRPALVRVAK